MLEHAKRQLDMIKTNMVIAAACILFLIKLRWPSNKSLYGCESLTAPGRDTNQT